MTAPLPCPSLLIVEDDATEALRLESALSRRGYRCTIAGDGDAALAHLTRAPFDAVLLDLVLPGLDGMGLLAAMAARALTVPVVVAVTPAGIDAAAGAIRAGARDFVVKPAGALRLEVALANAIALGRAATRPAQPDPKPLANDATPASRPALRVVSGRPEAPPAAEAPWAPLARPEQAPEPGFSSLAADGHIRSLEEIEADAIRFACDLYGGRLTEVARRLGIGRSTLYRKLADLHGNPVGGHQATPVLEPMTPLFVAAE